MTKEKILGVADSLGGPTGSNAVYRRNSIDYYKAKSENSSNKLKENSEISRNVIVSVIVENRIETLIENIISQEGFAP